MTEKPNAVAIAIAFCRAHIGDAYVFGATGPNTWDCSGLVMKAYAEAGILLPRTTGMMINVGTAVDKAGLQPGDLVFPDYHHVQIYTGNGRIIEAPQSGETVVERNMWGFWRARRVASGGQGLTVTIPKIPGVDTAASAVDALSSFAGVFTWLMDTNNWLRIAEFAAGAALILSAIIKMSGTGSIVKGVVSASGS